METRGLCQFWEASVLHQQLRRHYATNDPGLSERLVSQAEEAIMVLRVLYGRACEHIHVPTWNSSAVLRGLADDLLIIIREMQRLMEHYLETCTSDPYVQAISHTCPVATTNLPGRPPYLIDGAQVEAMMELGYSYDEEMAGMIGISTRTLRRHREQLGLPLATRLFQTMSWILKLHQYFRSVLAKISFPFDVILILCLIIAHTILWCCDAGRCATIKRSSRTARTCSPSS